MNGRLRRRKLQRRSRVKRRRSDFAQRIPAAHSSCVDNPATKPCAALVVDRRNGGELFGRVFIGAVAARWLYDNDQHDPCGRQWARRVTVEMVVQAPAEKPRRCKFRCCPAVARDGGNRNPRHPFPTTCAGPSNARAVGFGRCGNISRWNYPTAAGQWSPSTRLTLSRREIRECSRGRRKATGYRDEENGRTKRAGPGREEARPKHRGRSVITRLVRSTWARGDESADETAPARDAMPAAFGEVGRRFLRKGMIVNHFGSKRFLAGLLAAALLLLGSRAVRAVRADDSSGTPTFTIRVVQVTDNPSSAEAKNATSKYWLGIQCEPIGDAVRNQLELPKDQGLLVVRVMPGGPADKAEIRPNDSAVDRGRKETCGSGRSDFRGRNGKDSNPLKLKLLRGGKPSEVSVRPALRPENPQANLLPPGGDRETVEQWLKQFGMNAPSGLGNGFTFVHPGAG